MLAGRGRPKTLTKSLNSRFRNPAQEVLTALACDRLEIDGIFLVKHVNYEDPRCYLRSVFLTVYSEVQICKT